MKLVPELRFPRFHEDWLEKKLDDISLKIQDGTHFSPKLLSSGDFLYITSRNVKNGYIDLTVKMFVSKKEHDNIYRRCDVRKGDILLTKDGTIGQVCINPFEEEITLLSSVSFIRLDDYHDEEFLAQLLLSPLGQNEIERAIAGQALKRITLSKIRGFKYNFPALSEQKKIASFLTTVDQYIQALQKKESLLVYYKKGVAQKLFRQEIRFKDSEGNDFSNWGAKKLGDLYSFKSTNSYSRDKLNYKGGVVKNVHYGDIHTKFKTHFNILMESVPFINEEIDLDLINAENFVQEGDLLIADASEDYTDIGKAIEVVNLNNEKVVGGLHTFLLRRKDDSLSVGFGGHLMKEFGLRLKIKKIAQGTKVLSISTGRLAEISVQIPSLQEQQKITSFLSAVDEVIEKMRFQIERTQEFKKGLLQKMFV